MRKRKIRAGDVCYWCFTSFGLIMLFAPMLFCLLSTFIEVDTIEVWGNQVSVNFFEFLKLKKLIETYQIGLIWIGAGGASVGEFFFIIWIYKNQFKRREARMRLEEHQLNVTDKLLAIKEKVAKGNFKTKDFKQLEEIKNEIR